MVHVMAPKPAERRLPLFFNVDTSVGTGGQNTSMDDILLVQYFLSLIGKHSPDRAKFFPLTQIPVTGKLNQETSAGIMFLQQDAGASPDGRVSVARGYRYGGVAFTIVQLNFKVKGLFPQKWPNIEEMPECPKFLDLACRRALVGDVS